MNVRVEGPTGTIFEGNVTTSAHDVTSATGGTHTCDGTNNNANPTPGPTALTALDDAAKQAGFTWDGPWVSAFQDYTVATIAGVSQTATQFWGLLDNYQFTPVSGCQSQVHNGDQVLWAFDAFNQQHFLKLTGPSEVVAGHPFTVTVTDGATGVAVPGASVNGVLTDANGNATLELNPGTVTLKAELSGSLRSNALTIQVDPPDVTATVNVRVEGPTGTIFEGNVTTSAHDVTSATGGTHTCDGTNNNANPTPGPTALTALDDAAKQAGFTWDGPWVSAFQDYTVATIAGVSQTATQFWGLLDNYQFTPVSGCQSQVHNGDQVLWAFDAFNQQHFLKLTGPSEVVAGHPFTVTVTDGATGVAVPGASVNGVLTDANGNATLELNPGTVTLKAELSGSLRSNALTIQVDPPDRTPPVLTVPSSPVIAEATSAAGAVVTYSVSALDNVDGPVTPSCSPASGSTFPLGTTSVHCTATDTAGNVGMATFTVVVRDTTPPRLTLPAPITVPATKPNGATVTYAVTAIDAVSGAVTPQCLPRSGATFPIGTTTVACTATDQAGNTAHGSFTVFVLGATAQLANLSAQVRATTLPQKLSARLLVELASATTLASHGKNGAAALALGVFIVDVRANSGHAIAKSVAATWISTAGRIEKVLGH